MKGNGQTRVTRLEADLAHWGMQISRGRDGQRRLIIVCTCGHQDSWFNSTLDEAQEAVTHFTKMGWIMKRKCQPYHSSECYRDSKRVEELTMVNKPTNPPIPKPMTDTAITAAPIPAIGSDIRLTLRVGAIIEEHFDRDTRRYFSGWSDERVAKESGAALDFAIKVRKEGFGELAEDPAITSLRGDIVAIKDLVAQEEKRHQEWRATMEAQIRELDHKLLRLKL